MPYLPRTFELDYMPYYEFYKNSLKISIHNFVINAC